uniref:Uncharacterized protein n=1 Tax=Candidatus Kentrum sp. FM TaxID=2126340 RepID=A0A450TWT2_9GAMM|nr:MAG: hypothetical protein BECKFM1743C_GA0114222_107292 [Candidatus Kentron sp. FM]VFJ73514.1 MAG: hypothetical protein BECKFM1743A_GA0114220_107272 [Candidatus Kentron sp. FM]VFK20955.1 MAG: hypothetical protein BECKFM1743B_GA0114221_107472 [Candidatus Kentron sp. FM]
MRKKLSTGSWSKRLVLFIVIAGIIILTVAIADIFAFLFAKTFDDAFLSALAGAIAFAPAIAIAFALVFALTIGNAFVVLFTFVFAGAVFGFSVSTLVDSVAGIFASVFTGVSTGAIALSVSATFGSVEEQLNRNRSGFWLSGVYVAVMMFLSLWGIFLLGESERLKEGMALWTAFVYLPAINAFFDVASLQVSRFLLGKIRQDGRVPNIVWMVVDVIAAVALLVGLYWLIFLSLGAVDRWAFPEETIFPVARWRELFWETRDWFHPEILWLTLMALTTLAVTGLHLTFVFVHLFSPLRLPGDRERIAGLIGEIEAEAKDNRGQAGTDRCRRLASAYYLPWEHGIVLGTLTLWGIGYILYALVLHG